MRLIADIGGTNSRFGLSEGGRISSDTVHSYANEKWESIYAILTDYLARHEGVAPREIVLAVAGPMRGNRAVLTNRNWVVETGEFSRVAGGAPAYLLNDLTALGYATPKLRADQLSEVSAGVVTQTAVSQSIVVGIGTGFNISPVLQNGGVVMCPSVEAGHVGMPFGVVSQLSELGIDTQQFETVETLFSGRGFTDFCRQITGNVAIDGPTAIAAYGTANAVEVTSAIDAYAGLLGHLLRDLAFSYMPSSGIYLAGSVARSLMFVASQPCVKVFRQPANVLTCNNAPIWMIHDDLAALTGCAEFAV